MAKKFGHEEAFRGADLLTKLASKQIVLCGAGALGSNLADILCRQGVQKLRVIDFDRVEAGNVGTQLYGDGDVGAVKVAALQKRLFRDTSVEIDPFPKKLDDTNVKKAFKDANLVIDTFDNHESRDLVQRSCRVMKLDCVHAGTFEFYGEIVHDAIYKVPQNAAKDAQDVCDYPLARNLVLLVSTILAEEVMNFLTASKPRRESWSLTLADLKIGKYR